MKALIQLISKSFETHNKNLNINISFFTIALSLPLIFKLHYFSFFSAWHSMQFNTAISILLSGLSLTLYLNNKFVLSKSTSLLTFFISFATLLEYLFDLDLHIDQLLRTAHHDIMGHPGRMAMNSSFAFAVLSIAIILLANSKAKAAQVYVVGMLASLVMTLGSIKILGVILGLNGSHEQGSFLHMATPTAFGVFLGGSIVLMSVLGYFRNNQNESYRSLPLLITSVAIFATLILWQVLLNQRFENSKQLVRTEAHNLVEDIEARFLQTKLAVERLGHRIEYFGTHDKTYLSIEAKSYLSHLPALRRFGILDINSKVYWSYPAEIQKQIAGFSQYEDPIRRAALDEAKITRTPVLSQAIELKSGGKGFIMPTPLFKEENFLGFVYVSIEASKMFSNLSDLKKFQIQVKDRGTEIFSEVKEAAHRTDLTMTSKLNYGLSKFEIVLTPTDQFIANGQSQFPYLILFGGVLFSIFLGVTLQIKGLARFSELKFSENENLLKLRLERVIDATGEGILELEFASERLPFLDSQAKQIFELKSNESPTFDKILSQIHAHDRHRVTSEIKRHYRERTQRFEIEFRVADLDDQSKIKWARAKGKIVETSEKAALLVGTVSDITTRVEDRLRLEDALKRAEAGTQAKSAFLATMSHEIRTPLNGVIGMTDLILETNLDHHQRKYAEIIQQSGSNLLALINDILDFSKIEANKLEYESEEFSLSQVIESQIDVLALRARNQNISLQSFISPHLPKTIIGDGGKLGQILVNLMGNAVKFTKFGGVAVRVFTSKTKTANLDSTWVRFEVEDTGIGLSKEGIDKLFKPFSQVSQGSKRKYGGTGLGLSISKRLVEGMGGQIGVESKDGTGSTFWFEIEFKLSFIKQSVNSINFSDDLKKARVLVLDEDQISKNILFLYAESFGISPASSSFSGGLLDIKTAQQRKRNFNLVFIAPGDNLDGAILIARSAKELFGPAAPKFALLLNFGQAAPSEELGKDLFDEVIYKPFKQSHLIEVFERIKSPESVRKVEALQNFISSTPISEDQVSFNILVADDLAVNQMLAQKILESLGHRSKLAINGLEVLELVKAEKFDLVLMDCQMPELDGFGATAAIREIEKSRGEHMVIVALTANAMDGDHKRCTDAGMDDYLSKPIKKDKLNAMIEKWLNPSADNKIAG